MGFYVLKGKGATNNNPVWALQVENGRPDAVLSSMMLIPANCIAAASQYICLILSLLDPAEVAQCLLAPACFFDA